MDSKKRLHTNWLVKDLIERMEKENLDEVGFHVEWMGEDVFAWLPFGQALNKLKDLAPDQRISVSFWDSSLSGKKVFLARPEEDNGT